MKRYEYPSRIARVSTGLALAFFGSTFLLMNPPRGWMITVVCLIYAPLFALRPMQYIVLRDGELWYARLVGKGKILLSDVLSITSNGMQCTLRTSDASLRLPGVLTDYWECLRTVIDGAINAEVDSYTEELLDENSIIHKKVSSFLRMLHVSANIVLPGMAILGLIFLVHSVLT